MRISRTKHDLGMLVFAERDEVARLRAENETLRAALQDLQRQVHAHVQFRVRKHFSLMVADVAAAKALDQSNKGE